MASVNPGSKLTDVDLSTGVWYEPLFEKITTRKYITGVNAFHKDVTGKLELPQLLKPLPGFNRSTGKSWKRTHLEIAFVNIPDPMMGFWITSLLAIVGALVALK